MAEAMVDEMSSTERFYCHKCSSEIQPKLPDYTCPQCQSGFIEKLEESSGMQQPQQDVPPAPDPVSQFAELWGRTFLEEFRQNAANIPPSSVSENTVEGSSESHQSSPSTTPMPAQRPNNVMPPPGWPQHTRISIHSRVPGERNATSLQGLIEELLRGFGTGAVVYHNHGEGAGRSMPFPFGPVFNLHGNPADYAWGAGGLDNIISQLLNQLEGAGPPPAPKEKIDSLPSVKIRQEDVDKNLQCSVCMDDFAIDETVKKLPCNHHYHESCIIPWLELHGTCPVCRKTLDGQDTKTDETTVLSDMEQIAMSQQSPANEEPTDSHGPSFFDLDEYD